VRLDERCIVLLFAGFKQDSPGCFRGPSGLSPTEASSLDDVDDSMGIINFLLFSLISLKNPSFDGSSCLVFSRSIRCYFVFRLLKISCTCWAPIVVFPSSSVVSHASFLLLIGSTIFFIVGGFGGCTGLKDYAPTVFSVVLSWLGGFFCGGFFCGGFTVFSDMLWWLGSFSDVLSWLGGFFCGAAVFFLCF
jgi:hypothetical protein